MASALKRAPGLHLYLQVLEVPSAPPSSLLAVPPHPSLGCAGLQNPLPNGLSPRGNALPRALPPRSPLCRTGVRGHPRPGSPKPHEGQPPKAVKGLVLPLHPPSWRCWGARTSAVGADPVHHPPLEVRAVIAGIAVGEADGPGFIPRIDRLAFFPAPAHPVDVEAGGVHVQRGRPFGPPGQSSGRPP